LIFRLPCFDVTDPWCRRRGRWPHLRAALRSGDDLVARRAEQDLRRRLMGMGGESSTAAPSVSALDDNLYVVDTSFFPFSSSSDVG
jgi:hypothetical protein